MCLGCSNQGQICTSEGPNAPTILWLAQLGGPERQGKAAGPHAPLTGSGGSVPGNANAYLMCGKRHD